MRPTIGRVIRPRFSLRTLLLLVLLAGAGLTLASNAKRIWVLKGTLFESGIISAAFSPDGQRIATAGTDEIARVWELSSLRQVAQMNGHTHTLTTVSFSPDGSRILTASYDTSARIWDAFTGSQLQKLSEHSDYITSAMFSPDGTRVITASQDNRGLIWDVATGKRILSLRGSPEIPVNRVSCSPDGRWIASASWDGEVRLWDAKIGELSRTFSNLSWRGSVQFSPDSKKIVAVGANTATYDVTTGRPTLFLEGQKSYIYLVQFSPDGLRLLTISDKPITLKNEGRTARIWDAISGRLLTELDPHKANCKLAVYSRDGKQILLAREDGSLELWRRSRPEDWWGIFILPEFWLTVFLLAALVWSLIRDRPAAAKAS